MRTAVTIITEEEWAAVRERFPEGSQIRMPSGETGLLNFIDAGGTLHVDMEDGRSLTLTPDADDFTAVPPDAESMIKFKLYMPISATLGSVMKVLQFYKQYGIISQHKEVLVWFIRK